MKRKLVGDGDVAGGPGLTPISKRARSTRSAPSDSMYLFPPPTAPLDDVPPCQSCLVSPVASFWTLFGAACMTRPGTVLLAISTRSARAPSARHQVLQHTCNHVSAGAPLRPCSGSSLSPLSLGFLGTFPDIGPVPVSVGCRRVSELALLLLPLPAYNAQPPGPCSPRGALLPCAS